MLLANEMIRLRVMEEQDIQHICSWHNDYATTRMTTLSTFIPRTLDEELNWFRRKLADETCRYFMIEELDTGQTIGFISYSGLDYRNRKVLLSVVIGDCSYRGKGMAAQALQLMESFAANELNVRKITVQILAFNEPSLRLFSRQGYTVEGELKKEIYREGAYHDLVILSKFIEGSC